MSDDAVSIRLSCWQVSQGDTAIRQMLRERGLDPTKMMTADRQRNGDIVYHGSALPKPEEST